MAFPFQRTQKLVLEEPDEHTLGLYPDAVRDVQKALALPPVPRMVAVANLASHTYSPVSVHLVLDALLPYNLPKGPHLFDEMESLVASADHSRYPLIGLLTKQPKLLTRVVKSVRNGEFGDEFPFFCGPVHSDKIGETLLTLFRSAVETSNNLQLLSAPQFDYTWVTIADLLTKGESISEQDLFLAVALSTSQEPPSFARPDQAESLGYWRAEYRRFGFSRFPLRALPPGVLLNREEVRLPLSDGAHTAPTDKLYSLRTKFNLTVEEAVRIVATAQEMGDETTWPIVMSQPDTGVNPLHVLEALR